jgi:hypothetical protein
MIALPSCAQRGGARGGGSSHGASVSRGGFSTSRGGFSASASRGFSGYRGFAPMSGYRGFAPGRPSGLSPRFQAPGFQNRGAGYAGARPPYTGGDRYRRPYVPGYRPRYLGGAGYIAPGYGWGYPYLPWYPDDWDYDDSSAAPSQPDEGYDAGPPYPLPPEYPEIYPQPAASPNPAPEPASDETVTLVFKDGRAPLQIHDYVLTNKTLYVWDRHQLVIPTDQLDAVATAKANQEAGIDFQLPETAN